MEIQRHTLAKTTLKKNNIEGQPLQVFKKLQYSWWWYKNTEVGQGNIIESQIQAHASMGNCGQKCKGNVVKKE